MSRELSPQPNLEFLRKQAKALLAERQPSHPGWTLADAQHALARDYGFESWPKLKRHVESMSPDPRPFAGSWRANVPESQRHALNQFQRATLEFAVSGETVTISHVALEESGQEDRGTNTVRADGVERAFGYGYCVTAQWVGSRRIEVHATQGGRDAVRAVYEVSPDGRTMTVTTQQQRLVFDRA